VECASRVLDASHIRVKETIFDSSSRATIQTSSAGAMSVCIRDLPGEAIVVISEYLRATDLASAREVSKNIFCKSLISKAVLYQIENVYPKSWNSPTKDKRLPVSPSPNSRSSSIVEYGCEDLFITEVKSILFALSSPAPVNGRGYWISATWLANAKKFYESISLPDVRSSGKRTTPKKLAKIRQRRGSDVLPPWPEMNADITCCHGNLALSKNLRAKKRLLSCNFWQFLRKFYPKGPEYISTKASECILCHRDDETAKASALSIREAGIKSRRSEFLNGPLESLASRKSGVPTHLLTQKMIPGNISYRTMLCYTMPTAQHETISPLKTNSDFLLLHQFHQYSV
jgi:hypothetical protein